MFWRVVNACFAVGFLVGCLFTLLGNWELDNRMLTYWVMLALAIGFGHGVFDKHPK